MTGQFIFKSPAYMNLANPYTVVYFSVTMHYNTSNDPRLFNQDIINVKKNLFLFYYIRTKLSGGGQ